MLRKILSTVVKVALICLKTLGYGSMLAIGYLVGLVKTGFKFIVCGDYKKTFSKTNEKAKHRITKILKLFKF